MSEFLLTLEQHRFSRWCKYAAWIVLVLHLFSLVLQMYPIVQPFVMFGSTATPLPIGVMLQGILSSLAFALFSFFLLYAVAILVERNTSVEKR